MALAVCASLALFVDAGSDGRQARTGAILGGFASPWIYRFARGAQPKKAGCRANSLRELASIQDRTASRTSTAPPVAPPASLRAPGSRLLVDLHFHIAACGATGPNLPARFPVTAVRVQSLVADVCMCGAELRTSRRAGGKPETATYMAECRERGAGTPITPASATPAQRACAGLL